jgi:hypothetical protein
MSLTGQTETSFSNRFPKLLSRDPSSTRRPSPTRWIGRNRAAIEATVTITLAMTTPVLVAVATLQPSLTA